MTSMYAGQSLLTTSATATIKIPGSGGVANPPYNYITASRVEVRFNNIDPCKVGSVWGNWLRLTGRTVSQGHNNIIVGFGCSTVGLREYTVYQGSSTRSLGAIDYPEMILRLQRDGIGIGRYSVEVWRPDGSGYMNLSYDSPNAAMALTADLTQNNFVAGGGSTQVAWLRWYSSTVPEGAPMPKDTGAQPGDLGNWELNGNLLDTSGHGLHASRSGGCSPAPSCFVPSPIHPPVVQFGIANALAGSTMVLDAGESFTYDGSQLTDHVWNQTGGPSTAIFEDRRAVRASLRGLVAGEYTFALTVQSASGSYLSGERIVKVRNVDANGFWMFPSNTGAGAVELSFNMNTVPDTVAVRITVRKPDGRLLPTVTCTVSPCMIPVDETQGDHLAMIEYMDSGGVVQSASQWQTVPVTQVPRSQSLTSYSRPHINLYGLGTVATRERVAAFLADRSMEFNGGAVSVLKHNPKATQLAYSDHAGLYPEEMYALYDSAAKHGYSTEKMLLHLGINYRTKNGYVWHEMDRFDAFDKTGNHRNGVLLVNNGTFVDKTTAAYDTTVGDVPVTDKLLLGYAEPFDEVNVTLATPASGFILWEYWNGSSWRPLALRQDGTAVGSQRFAKSGKVLFTPPSDWQRKAENGSRIKWWVRVSRIDGQGPVASRITGDDWMSAGSLRGWDATSSTRVNIGLGALEYNPTPPAHASARFRHQARALGIWANNCAMFNIGDVQSGERTVARYIIDRVANKLSTGVANGVLIDNGVPVPTLSTPADWQSYTEMAGKAFLHEAIESYRAIGAYMRSLWPATFLGVNSAVWSLVQHGEYYFDESYKHTHLDVQPWGAFRLWPANDWRSAAPEQLKPSNNPRGVVGWIQVYDNLNSESLQGSTWVVWDKAVRGPMTALASYLTYANPNTRFYYHSGPNFIYLSLDEFEYRDSTSEWTTGSDITANISNATKYVSGNFSSFPAELMVRMGPSGEYVTWRRISSTQLSTTEGIGQSYSAGTQMFRIRTGRMSSEEVPPLDLLRSWGQYFPAMSIDVGVADLSGHNGGECDRTWKSAAASGTLNGIQRRDLTRAIVLFASGAGVGSTSGVHLNQYGSEIVFAAEGMPATLYPLRPDGSTGPGINSIRLRTAEGVVLMRTPVY